MFSDFFAEISVAGRKDKCEGFIFELSEILLVFHQPLVKIVQSNEDTSFAFLALSLF
jgi:hypothetical protein